MHRSASAPWAVCLATACLMIAWLGPISSTAAQGAPGPTIHDPTRPISEVGQTEFVVQWFTDEPVESRIRVREAKPPFEHAVAVHKGMMGEDTNPWDAAPSMLVNGDTRIGVDVQQSNPALDGVNVMLFANGGEPTRYHQVQVTGLKPGTRYYYQVYAGDEKPTTTEREWGAEDGWRRERAVATLAPDGQKTIIHYPVKVVVMTNVYNLHSGIPLEEGEDQPENVTYQRPPAGTDPNDIPVPPLADEALRQMILDEFDKAALFFWVNSHMRYWVDFHVTFDERPQRWGDEPAPDAPLPAEWLRGMPLCRSYDNMDYSQPGGGGFTIFDPRDPHTVFTDAIVEEQPYPGQAEVALPRRYNHNTGVWDIYTSGGGTLSVGGVPRGIPGRSQFFGGHDTGWLMTHEFHHQMESLSAYSLAHREDERIVFNHWAPRSRGRAPDGASSPAGVAAPHPWTTSSRHGEHYDGMAYWDRTITHAQWLRILLGNAITVTDADNDGVPDNDPRLPLDERRFGSSTNNPTTDGFLNDLDKVMLATFAPEPLQPMFTKPEQTFVMPSPTDPDSDGDSVPDYADPAPLVPHPPFIWPKSVSVDGDASEWDDIPPAGVIDAQGEYTVTFKQAHDAAAYYGLIEIKGDFRSARVVLDGEGNGAYAIEGVMAFNIIRAANRDGTPPAVRDTFWGTKGFDSAATTTTARSPRGDVHTVEFSIKNWAEGGWYWSGGGREVGATVEVRGRDGGIRSMYEPYRMFYARMVEDHGVMPMPPHPPSTITRDEADLVLLPGDERVTINGPFVLEDDRWRHTGGPPGNLQIDFDDPFTNYDLYAEIEGVQDFSMGAFTVNTEQPSTLTDYIAFIGGYNNTRSRIRLFGSEQGDSDVMVTPGRHTMQFSRRDGTIWVIFDGKPALWVADKKPDSLLDRLHVGGGYGGLQNVYEIRIRTSLGGENPMPHLWGMTLHCTDPTCPHDGVHAHDDGTLPCASDDAEKEPERD